jgi:hypothetical protein
MDGSRSTPRPQQRFQLHAQKHKKNCRVAQLEDSLAEALKNLEQERHLSAALRLEAQDLMTKLCESKQPKPRQSNPKKPTHERTRGGSSALANAAAMGAAIALTKQATKASLNHIRPSTAAVTERRRRKAVESELIAAVDALKRQHAIISRQQNEIQRLVCFFNLKSSLVSV